MENTAEEFYDDNLKNYSLLNLIDPATAEQAIQMMEEYHQAKLKNHGDIGTVSDLLPSPEKTKKAMANKKTLFIKNMDKFSSRKNAYKTGWRDCIDWLKINDR